MTKAIEKCGYGEVSFLLPKRSERANQTRPLPNCARCAYTSRSLPKHPRQVSSQLSVPRLQTGAVHQQFISQNTLAPSTPSQHKRILRSRVLFQLIFASDHTHSNRCLLVVPYKPFQRSPLTLISLYCRMRPQSADCNHGAANSVH
jgi:hypothetical protein